MGYPVENYKLFVFTLTAAIGIAGALYYPQAGIINPAEQAPIASIYLAVWVAIGGRGRLYGAVLGAIFVSLVSSWFTSGQAPDLPLGFYTISWVDWWLVILGVSFVIVTIFTPKGLGGLFDLSIKTNKVQRHGENYGPDEGSLRERSFSMSSLLEVSGLSVTFDGFKAINNLSFRIGKPELRAIIGPNGAGKTTLMDIITGKTDRTQSIKMGTENLNLIGLSEAKIAQQGIGRKFQKPTVFEDQTVRSNLLMSLKKAEVH